MRASQIASCADAARKACAPTSGSCAQDPVQRTLAAEHQASQESAATLPCKQPTVSLQYALTSIMHTIQPKAHAGTTQGPPHSATEEPACAVLQMC